MNLSCAALSTTLPGTTLPRSSTSLSSPFLVVVAVAVTARLEVARGAAAEEGDDGDDDGGGDDDDDNEKEEEEEEEEEERDKKWAPSAATSKPRWSVLLSQLTHSMLLHGELLHSFEHWKH